MSIRVYGADQNPAIDKFLYRCNCSSGANLIASGRGIPVTDRDGRRAVQLLAGADTCDESSAKESIGRSNLIPFGRVPSPWCPPQKLHYETPHAGDRTIFARHRRHRIHVSSRSRFNYQILPVAALAVAAGA